MTPARLVAMVALATALALALVHQNARIRQAGYRLSELRAAIAEEQAELATYQAHLSKLKNPQRILALVRWLGLELHERPVPHVAEPSPQTGPEKPVAALTSY